MPKRAFGAGYNWWLQELLQENFTRMKRIRRLGSILFANESRILTLPGEGDRRKMKLEHSPMFKVSC
jgi:hypothetical protein